MDVLLLLPTHPKQTRILRETFTTGFRIGDIKKNILQQRQLQDVDMPEYKLTDCDEKIANWLSRIVAENRSLNGNVQAKVTSTREVPPYKQKMVVPFISSKVKPNVSVIVKDASTDDSTNPPTDEDDKSGNISIHPNHVSLHL